MTETGAGTLARICRYPVKGLSVDDLARVTLRPDAALPGDRRFAIARGTARLDPVAPGWASKDNFVQLVRTERLAQIEAAFDSDSGELVIKRKGRPVARGIITQPTGRTVIEQFLAAFLAEDLKHTPKLIDAGDMALTDVSAPRVSILNLASVRDLARVTGSEVDPVRFRANLLLDGLPPWVERAWIGKSLDIGPVRLEVTDPIERCAATTVNPDTAARDLNIPKLLQRGYGDVHMGVYARVQTGGEVAIGAPVAAP